MICKHCGTPLRYVGDVECTNEHPFFEWYSEEFTLELHACPSCGTLFVGENTRQRLQMEANEEKIRNEIKEQNKEKKIHEGNHHEYSR